MKLSLLFACYVLIQIFAYPAKAQSQPVDDRLLLEYYQAQKYNEASAYLKSIYREPVTDQAALRNLAYTSQMAGKLVDAEGYYQRLFEQDTTKLSVLNSIAGINLRRGNLNKAWNYYTRIIALDSTNFFVLKQLAEISFKNNDTLKYVKYLAKANAVNTEDADVASDLSNWYVSVKQFDKAEAVLNKATTADPENVILLQSLLRLVSAQLKWAETVNVGTKLLQLGDGSYPTAIKLGVAYYRLNNFTCCLETLLGMDAIQQTETSHYYAGLSYKALKNFPKAVIYFNKAIKEGISPATATYYGELAGSHQELKQVKKALFNYERGLQFEEKPLLLYSLATLYDSDLKNKSKAVKYYKKYLATHPPALQQVFIDYCKNRISVLSGQL
jgi:tetratricopeptide (TPR) repeat protein